MFKKESGSIEWFMIIFLFGCVGFAFFAYTSNQTDAKVASHNLSKASDMFEVNRRIVFYNSITNTYIQTITGRCSIEKDRHDNQLEVTCKISDHEFKKEFLGLSDNVTYFVQQLETKDVSVYHYKVEFKPQTILPDVDLNLK